MKKLLFTCLIAAFAGTANADLAFIGFNADGTDGFSLVATEGISSGTTYWLTDREWDAGTSSFNTGEGLISVTFDQDVEAGCILNINDIDDQPNNPTITDGNAAAIMSTFGGDVSTGISSGGEGLYFFQDNTTFDGSTVDVEIASFVNDTGQDPFANAKSSVDFTGTSLAEVDVTAYTGPTTGLGSFAAYVGLIQDESNWTFQGDGSGDQSGNYAPATGKFEINAIPEPSTMGILTLASVFVMRRRR